MLKSVLAIKQLRTFRSLVIIFIFKCNSKDAIVTLKFQLGQCW